MDTLEGVGGGVREAGEERVAVVKARQNETTSLVVASVLRYFLIRAMRRRWK